MKRRERVVLENICMIRDGSKVLVEDKVGKDIRGIIFPGGHVEEHVPIVDSVIREIKEETGLIIENPVLCGVKNWIDEDGTRYIVFLFKAEKYSGTLTSSSEGRVQHKISDRLHSDRRGNNGYGPVNLNDIEGEDYYEWIS